MMNNKQAVSAIVFATILAIGWLGGSTEAFAQDDCCTDHLACQDGRWCSGIEYCNCWGVCIAGARPNCEDGNPCTVDTCVDDVIDAPGLGYGMGHCQYADICGGCTVPADCDDGNLCTIDQCIGGSCVNDWSTGCCITNGDCDDANLCTTDTCSGNVCSNVLIANCCQNSGDCDDTDPCTTDICDTDNQCVNTAVAGCCVDDATCEDTDNCTEHSCNLGTNLCELIWSGSPPGDCCNVNADCDDGLDCNGWEVCDDSVVPRGVCNSAPDVDCDDGYDCTTDACDESGTWCATAPDFCLCTHDIPVAPPDDTCASAGGMVQSGSGLAMQWNAMGDTHCSADDYVPDCAGSGPDNVHYLDIPTDGSTNHNLYEYHVMVEAPGMDPTVALFPVDTCGGGGQWGCNATSLGMCWTGTGYSAADGNDACFDSYAWSNAPTVLPEGSYAVLVDSANPLGGNYDVHVTRASFNNTQCGNEVEIQMGGKWYGNTYSSTQYGCAFCTSNPLSGSGGSCADYTCNEDYAQAEFEIDHTGSGWTNNMGYVVTAESVGGFDPALSMFKHGCYSNMSTNLAQVYGVGCNNDMDSSTSPRIVTGIIPAFYSAEIRLNGYNAGGRGEYELTVEPDSDGDGLPDTLDSWLGSMWGATASPPGDLQDGPIEINSVPYSDTRTSWEYPNDSLEECGLWILVCFQWVGRNAEEVYYKLNVGGSVDVRVSPMARGDVWTHANVPDGWDPVLWYSNDCSSFNYEDDGGTNEYEERTGISGNGCIAVDGYQAGDGGYFLLEVTR